MFCNVGAAAYFIRVIGFIPGCARNALGGPVFVVKNNVAVLELRVIAQLASNTVIQCSNNLF